MKVRYPMPILRPLYYATLIALIAVLCCEPRVQATSPRRPSTSELGLGVAAAYSTVRATRQPRWGRAGWNGQSVRWAGVVLFCLLLCGLASYYSHMYLEDDEESDTQQDTTISRVDSAVTRGWRSEELAGWRS